MDKIDPVPDAEAWCRHLLTPEECKSDEDGPYLNPKIYENLFRRSKSVPRAISGRLLSLARGTLRSAAEKTLATQKGKNKHAATWDFHGILHCEVGTLRSLLAGAQTDVKHAPLNGDKAHANFVSAAEMFNEDALTDDSIVALEQIQFVRSDSKELSDIDVEVGKSD